MTRFSRLEKWVTLVKANKDMPRLLRAIGSSERTQAEGGAVIYTTAADIVEGTLLLVDESSEAIKKPWPAEWGTDTDGEPWEKYDELGWQPIDSFPKQFSLQEFCCVLVGLIEEGFLSKVASATWWVDPETKQGKWCSNQLATYTNDEPPHDTIEQYPVLDFEPNAWMEVPGFPIDWEDDD